MFVSNFFAAHRRKQNAEGNPSPNPAQEILHFALLTPSLAFAPRHGIIRAAMMTWKEIVSQLQAHLTRAVDQNQISLPCTASANPGRDDLFYVVFSDMNGLPKAEIARSVLPKKPPAPYHLPFVIRVRDIQNRRLEYNVHRSGEVTTLRTVLPG